MENPQQVPVFFTKMEYSFGNFAVSDKDAVMQNDNQLEFFQAHQGQAIMVIFLGVVNHWIALVIHKTGFDGEPHEIYLLDSSNIDHLSLHEGALAAQSIESRCWKKIRVGLKPTNKFMVEMSIQSKFDMRHFYQHL